VSLLRVRLQRIHTGRRRVEVRDASGAVTTRGGRALIAGVRALALLNERRRSLGGSSMLVPRRSSTLFDQGLGLEKAGSRAP
jgi:hypothetical protein